MSGPNHPVFAALYDRMSGSTERAVMAERRQRLLAELTGDVLDVGAGTGVNLGYYQRAARVVAAEPDPAMRRRLVANLGKAVVPVEVSAAAAEALDHPDGSFDTVVFTLVLCSVADPDRALAQAHRVLRPSGRLIVVEHVRGGGRLAAVQDTLTPLWSRVLAGCHPNRDVEAAIERQGFTIERIDRFAVPPSWSPASPMLEVVARR
jgi:ubiquinone/menaquinone biosynthesis C-methylase UbiE